MANTFPDQLMNRHHHQQQQQQHMMLSPAELENILRESKHRWLRPSEILQILSNYNIFKLSSEPPHLPPAGSLFLFDRKSLRYFRRDKHNWKKKKDGRTVREAHEKLKVGSVDALHCYYAHGEDNENFQRRCYWMLDEKLDHIVLVHYREVRERYKFSASPAPIDHTENLEPSSAASFPQAASPVSAIEKAYTVPQNKADWKTQALSSYGASLFASDTKGLLPGNPHGSQSIGVNFEQGTGPSPWLETFSSNKCEVSLQDQSTGFLKYDIADYAILMASATLSDSGPAAATKEAPQSANEIHHHSELQTVIASTSQAGKLKDDADNNDSGNLKKLDSFGRWMSKEMGQDCDDSLILSDSGNYWDTLAAENEEREVSSLSHHMQLDVDSLGPSLSQVQLFTIQDFTPEWGYTGVETKVLIVGTFLEKPKSNKETRWGCMFGEIEVSAEVLNGNVIRCRAPVHAQGNVPFYVTCRDRLACSEVREFLYRENPIKISSLSERSVQQLEVCFEVRLAKLFSLGIEGKWLNCSVERCNACKLRTITSDRSNSGKEQDWGIEKWMITEGDRVDTTGRLIRSLMTDKLREWLLCKAHEGGKGPDIIDDEGQGVFHLVAGLGYYWAVGLVVEAGGNPNFRDAQGRTALHWASYFGREETVVALVGLGVDPTAVDDPTPSFPGGRSAADVASGQGHKGIAGYLAEASLTRQLFSLSSKRDVVDSEDATTATENARIAAQVSVPMNLAAGEQLSLKQSLAAVRKSAHAAALIQAMYREKKALLEFRSSQNRRSDNNDDDDDELHEVSLDLAALGALKNPQKRSHIHSEDYLHSAAVKIQKKYRGWKGRKHFLMIRERVVKIQAHMRGHQVRRNYKKVVWSVSIVEKAILRWRRKGVGLRGFHAKDAEGELERDSDEYEFLITSRQQKSAGVEKALARVTSMVRHPEARDQYLRLVTKFEALKVRDGSNS